MQCFVLILFEENAPHFIILNIVLSFTFTEITFNWLVKWQKTIKNATFLFLSYEFAACFFRKPFQIESFFQFCDVDKTSI